MNCLVIIKQIYEEFTNSEKKIADIIVQEPEKAITFNSHELAKYSMTSPASVVRFAKKIGFNSYGDMKIELARNIESSDKQEITKLLKSEDTLEVVSKKIVRNIEVTLDDVLNLIDFKRITEAVEKIKKGRLIYLLGVGASSVVAQDFQQKLVRINKPCIFHTDYHLGVAGAVHIDKEDVVIAISYQGNTKEVNAAVKQAKQNGATCIAITSCLNSPLHQLADILITLPNTENDIRIGAVTSRYAQLLIVDLLFAGIAKENFTMIEEYLVKTRESINELKK